MFYTNNVFLLQQVTSSITTRANLQRIRFKQLFVLFPRCHCFSINVHCALELYQYIEKKNIMENKRNGNLKFNLNCL